MSTTIAVSKETLERLKVLKELENMKTFDEVIDKMLLKKKKLDSSYFGKFKGIGSFKREKIGRFA